MKQESLNKAYRTDCQISVAILLKTSMWAGLTCVLSFVAVPLPFSPVPLTGQTFGVMLAGIALGPWWGAASMVLYLGIGCLGFPVFAGGRSGPGTLLGPTGGYLLGFVAGAWVTGFVRASIKKHMMKDYVRSRSNKKHTWAPYLIPILLGGILTVHAFGACYLAWFAKLTLREAFAAGSLPFLPVDLLKAALGAIVACRFETAGLLDRD